MQDVKISVRLPKWLVDELDKQAKSHRYYHQRSRSWVVRKILVEYVKEVEAAREESSG